MELKIDLSKTISYKESNVIRGIAILMMIYLHCFNYYPQSEIIDIELFGNNLSWWLTKTAGLCVPLYCFLSGYGLYKKYPYDYKYCITKSYALIKQYWIFLAAFISIGTVFFSAYEINLANLFSNFLGYNTTYNQTLWFLLPYIIILISSPYLIKKFNSSNILITTTIVFLLFIVSSILLKFKSTNSLVIPDIFTVILEVFRLLISFFFGAMMARYGVPKIQSSTPSVKKIIIITALILLIVFRCLILNTFVAPFFNLFLIIILVNIDYSKIIENLLGHLGAYSLSLWFVHAYFTYGYLKFTIYWMKYPILIFISAVVLSYIIAWGFNKLLKRI